MFEKEAEEKADEKYPIPQVWNEIHYVTNRKYAEGFIDGAEFGYNKASEWHNLEEDPNDLPNKELEEKQLLARVRNYEEECIFAYYMIDKYNSLSGKRFYSDISCDYPINKKDIIAWKEIVLPSEPMRSLNKEEQKNYTEAINKVYKPTGVKLFDKE